MGIQHYIQAATGLQMADKIKDVVRRIHKQRQHSVPDFRGGRSQKRELQDFRSDGPIDYSNQYSTNLDSQTSEAQHPWEG